MDARSRLKLYLEQRKELGESELLLDSLPVEDVLKLLGANATATAKSVQSKRSYSDGAGMPGNSNAELAAERYVHPGDTPSLAARVNNNSENLSSDWRAQLRGAVDDSRVASPPAVATRTTNAPDWLAALNVPMGIAAGGNAIGNSMQQADAAVAQLQSLDEIASAVASCDKCGLRQSAINPVPGEGNINAGFVCVGEAPGQSEDEQGRPFVGAAGELLTKIIGAIGFSRGDIFICNVLKHRPPSNRNPLPDEVHACSPYLLRQLELLRPRVILALGNFAARTLLGSDQSIGRLRGRVHMYHGIPLVATYHPAALLRNSEWKRPTWEDVQLARRVYDASLLASSTNTGSAK